MEAVELHKGATASITEDFTSIASLLDNLPESIPACLPTLAPRRVCLQDLSVVGHRTRDEKVFVVTTDHGSCGKRLELLLQPGDGPGHLTAPMAASVCSSIADLPSDLPLSSDPAISRAEGLLVGDWEGLSGPYTLHCEKVEMVLRQGIDSQKLASQVSRCQRLDKLAAVSFDSLHRDLVISCLVTGLRSNDLARLQCTARGFRQVCQDAAQQLCAKSPFAAVVERHGGEGWLQLLSRMERGLRFTTTNENLVKLDRVGTATHTGKVPVADRGPSILPNDTGLWATAVCADAVMSDGIHRCTFKIQTKHQTTIGIVPAAWATRTESWQAIRPASAGGWASDQEFSYLLGYDGRLWDGEKSDWAAWDYDATQAKFARASEVELELDLVDGKLTARVDVDGDDRVWEDCMAYGLVPLSNRLGGFCWCAELAGEGDIVHVAWSPGSYT